MRWVKFDTSVNGIFSREVCPEDSEYLQAHMDTFKCMWHEQTRNYWVRMIISLREYVRKHIFTYESLERLGAPVSVFEVIIEYAYINICTNFAEDSFGKAREFLRAVISVCANKDMMCQIGARPLSNDPFYNKFTRDYYRTVFGQPSSTLKLQLQTYIAAPLYARFAAGVIALIKQWVQATDCSLKDFYTKFHAHPYWTYPNDYCPQKVLFRYIRDKFYGWESPDCQEVEEVMKRAPDRETAFAEVVELLPPDFADYDDAELSDCGSEGSADSFSPSGIKLWSDIVFGVSDDLLSGAPFHVKELCATCMGEPSSDCSTDEEFDEEFLLDPKVGEVCDGLKYDYKFWRHPKVVALLDAAEKRFRDRLLDKLTEEAVVEESFYSGNKTVPPQRKGKKSGKKPRDVVSISINLTASASARQPAFMKNGAVPPATSRPEVIHLEQESTKCAQLSAAFEQLMMKISNETPPTGSSQQQAGNTSNAPKPQEAAKRPRKASNSQEGTMSQDAAKVPDKPSSKEAGDKLASGDAAASKAVGPSKKVNKKPLVNGDVAVSNEAGPSKKIDKKPLVNGDVSKEAGPSKKVDKPLVNGGTALSKEVGPSKKVDKKRLLNGDAAVSKEVGPSKKVDKLLVNGDAAVSKPAVRKCATCGKSEGVKLKKCSLCVQKQMDPAYYCSRECQMEDWDDHQAVHIDDTD